MNYTFKHALRNVNDSVMVGISNHSQVNKKDRPIGIMTIITMDTYILISKMLLRTAN